MKKFINECCTSGVEDNFHFDNTNEPPRDTLLPTEPPPPQPDLSKEPNQVIRVRNHGGVIIAPNARFSANGGEHVVVIRLQILGEGGGGMSVAVDGNAGHVWTLARRGKHEGNAELEVDGMVFDFFWDVEKSPMEFLFRRKAVNIWSDIFGWRHEEEGYSLMILGD